METFLSQQPPEAPPQRRRQQQVQAQQLPLRDPSTSTATAWRNQLYEAYETKITLKLAETVLDIDKQDTQLYKSKTYLQSLGEKDLEQTATILHSLSDKMRRALILGDFKALQKCQDLPLQLETHLPDEMPDELQPEPEDVQTLQSESNTNEPPDDSATGSESMDEGSEQEAFPVQSSRGKATTSTEQKGQRKSQKEPKRPIIYMHYHADKNGVPPSFDEYDIVISRLKAYMRYASAIERKKPARQGDDRVDDAIDKAVMATAENGIRKQYEPTGESHSRSNSLSFPLSIRFSWYFRRRLRTLSASHNRDADT